MGFRKNRQEIILPLKAPAVGSTLSEPPPPVLESNVNSLESEPRVLKNGFVDLVSEEKSVEQPTPSVKPEQKKTAKKQSKKKQSQSSETITDDSGNVDKQ